LTLINEGDILYLAMKGSKSFVKYNLNIGEDFNYNAILDDYQIVEELGVGGFGKVMLGRHKEEKKEVAIKFMDVSENRKLILFSLNN
jgi:serine/threonine protein kinase